MRETCTKIAAPTWKLCDQEAVIHAKFFGAVEAFYCVDHTAVAEKAKAEGLAEVTILKGN